MTSSDNFKILNASCQDTNINFGIDELKSDKTSPLALQLRGYCFDKKNRSFKNIRAVLADGSEIRANRKHPRPDVAILAEESQQAALSGFAIHKLPRNQKLWPIKIEYRFQNDEWQPLCEIEKKPLSFIEKITNIFCFAFSKKNKQAKFNYQNWINNVEQKSIPSSDEISATIQQWQTEHGEKSLPLISVVMPVFNTNEKFLRQCIDSVIAQSYPNWQFCIADDFSNKPHIRPLLEEYQKIDKRIQVVHREDSGHICAASNSALDLATGDFVALLDHDDLLPKDALFFVAQAIINNPEADLFYSDEDKINEQNQRSNPYFKSAFNYDLFLSQNCFSHLGVLRRELIEKAGRFRIGMHGSQDWDLVLRCLEICGIKKIVHIPRVLYHWRIIAGSTALDIGEKPYALVAAQKSVGDHLQRIQAPPHRIQAQSNHFLRVHFLLPQPPPSVEIIIPNRDQPFLLKKVIEGLQNNTKYDNFSITIVDNDSQDGKIVQFYNEIKQQKNYKILSYPYQFNYAAMNNLAAQQSQADFLCLLNNDIEIVQKNWLSEMVAQAARKNIGAVGAKLIYPNGKVQHAGVVLGLNGVAGHAFAGAAPNTIVAGDRLNLAQNVSAVTAACLVVDRKKYLAVDGMDEQEFAVAYNDVDLCLKLAEKGWRTLYTPFAILKHHESYSRHALEKTSQRKKQANTEDEIFIKKWQKYYPDRFYRNN